MNKQIVIIVLVIFILYMVLGMIITIPKTVDNILMGISAVGALYYIIFYTGIVDKFKNDFNKEIDKNIDNN
ncbi:hypothetical protein CMT22_17750 [Elizabethkingia anophelis]|nr:hypothetical protein [Elizabethkingia anophelis]